MQPTIQTRLSIHYTLIETDRVRSIIPKRLITSITCLSLALSGHAIANCTLRPASTWHTTITAGPYKLLFDDDANLAAKPQIDHARHGTAFVTNTDSLRIAGPNGTCWTNPSVGIVTTPIFIANGRYLYIPTYSGGDAYLFVVDAQTCATIWHSPDLDHGMPTHKPYGFFLPGVGRLFIGPNYLPYANAP